MHGQRILRSLNILDVVYVYTQVCWWWLIHYGVIYQSLMDPIHCAG